MSSKVTMLFGAYREKLLDLAAEYAEDNILRLRKVLSKEAPKRDVLERELQQSLGAEVSLEDVSEVFQVALRTKGWTTRNRDLYQQLRDYRDWLDAQEDEFEEKQLAQYRESAEKVLKTVAEKVKDVETFLQNAVRRIDLWRGSPILAYPIYSKEYPWTETPVFDVQLQVPGKPGFTLFSDITLGDVLEAKDSDFFKTEDAEIDYFNLVAELESPGSTSKPGKRTIIWTARPTKDRQKYLNAHSVPSGIFAASNIDHVAGLASDLGNSEVRDIYRVVIDSRYLRVTLDQGRLKEYQVIGQGEVPVLDMELYQEGQQQKMARSVIWKVAIHKILRDKSSLTRHSH
jgi:hypothetical protein